MKIYLLSNSMQISTILTLEYPSAYFDIKLWYIVPQDHPKRLQCSHACMFPQINATYLGLYICHYVKRHLDEEHFVELDD